MMTGQALPVLQILLSCGAVLALLAHAIRHVFQRPSGFSNRT